MNPRTGLATRPARARGHATTIAALALGLIAAALTVLAWQAYPRVGVEWLLGAIGLCG